MDEGEGRSEEEEEERRRRGGRRRGGRRRGGRKGKGRKGRGRRRNIQTCALSYYSRWPLYAPNPTIWLVTLKFSMLAPGFKLGAETPLLSQMAGTKVPDKTLQFVSHLELKSSTNLCLFNCHCSLKNSGIPCTRFAFYDPSHKPATINTPVNGNPFSHWKHPLNGNPFSHWKHPPQMFECAAKSTVSELTYADSLMTTWAFSRNVGKVIFRTHVGNR